MTDPFFDPHKGHHQGTREIRVILYAKDDPFCATALADELPIEDMLGDEKFKSPGEITRKEANASDACR
jgi:hypothetical protein